MFYENSYDITTFKISKIQKHKKTFFKDLFTKATFSKSAKILQNIMFSRFLQFFVLQKRSPTVRNRLIHFCSNRCLAVVSVDQNTQFCKILRIKPSFAARKSCFLKIQYFLRISFIRLGFAKILFKVHLKKQENA